jgi:hypothetical protein
MLKKQLVISGSDRFISTWYWSSCWGGPETYFGYAVKTLWFHCSHYLHFQSFHLERTWWMLFWAYLMKVILNVPDEGYPERTWWMLFWAYLMKVVLNVPDEGYSERTWWRLFWAYLMKVILSVPDDGYSERTWWRLFWAYLMNVILSVPDQCYSERTWWRLFWAYLMKVILSVPDEGYSERTWWRLFQKRVARTKFDIFAFYFFYHDTLFMKRKFNKSIPPISTKRTIT